MNGLPEDVQHLIWTLYYKEVVQELQHSEKGSVFTWLNASPNLVNKVKNENGAYQHSFNDLPELVEDHNLVGFQQLNCHSCKQEGYFPCFVCKRQYFDDQISCQFII